MIRISKARQVLAVGVYLAAPRDLARAAVKAERMT